MSAGWEVKEQKHWEGPGDRTRDDATGNCKKRETMDEPGDDQIARQR